MRRPDRAVLPTSPSVQRFIRPGDARVLTRLLEKFGGEVEAGDARAGPRRGDGDDAGAGAHVEHVSPAAMPANFTSCAATGVVNVAVGANDAHISRCRFLSSANGSDWFMRFSILMPV